MLLKCSAEIALCSESIGSKVAPLRLTSSRNKLPEQTKHSLLAKAITAPRLTAVKVGNKGNFRPYGVDDKVKDE